MAEIVYLGLGSNLGDREARLRSALLKLQSPELRLRRVSGLYETEPIGYLDQAWFLNLVAEFETSLTPHQLLERTQGVERDLGRERIIANGPRTVDVDVLFYGDLVLSHAELVVPHPRYHERRFVLAPLAELNPLLRDPVSGRTAAELLQSLRGQTVREAGRLIPESV